MPEGATSWESPAPAARCHAATLVCPVSRPQLFPRSNPSFRIAVDRTTLLSSFTRVEWERARGVRGAGRGMLHERAQEFAGILARHC